MRLFGRDPEKEREQREFHHNIVTAHTANRAAQTGIPNKQMIDSLGTAYFLQQDENVVNVIMQYCPELIPAFSRLNATSQIKEHRDRRLLELRLEDILLHKEMELGDEGDVETLSLIKSLRVFGVYRILDALGGYRGKLVTEEIERTTHVIEEPKKKSIL